MLRIFIVTSIIFFIPGCILGTISPVVVRLTLNSLDKAGNVIGKIYAFSTLGAIIGTFATGFLLISWMGTRTIILSMGSSSSSLPSSREHCSKRKNNRDVYNSHDSLLLAYSHLPVRGPLKWSTYYYKESDYFTIKLTKTTSVNKKTPLEAMILDHLIHSYVCLSDRCNIEYEYERIYADVLKWRFKKKTPFRTLTIGGGDTRFRAIWKDTIRTRISRSSRLIPK
jgi:hypothetical protein